MKKRFSNTKMLVVSPGDFKNIVVTNIVKFRSLLLILKTFTSVFCNYDKIVYFCFSGVRFTRFLVLCVMFCLSFFFGHCVVCPSIYGFWLPLWYLHTLLVYQDLWHFYSLFYYNIRFTLADILQKPIYKLFRGKWYKRVNLNIS